MYPDQVEVFSKTTGEKQFVPRHFLDDPVLGADFEVAPAARDAVRRGQWPTEDWKVAELERWLTDRGASREGASTKAELLEVITAFRAEHAPTQPAGQAVLEQPTTAAQPEVDQQDPDDEDPVDGEDDESDAARDDDSATQTHDSNSQGPSEGAADGTTTTDTPVTGDPT